MKSPTNGMNSTKLMEVANLLFVKEYKMLITIESNISPTRGLLKIGAAK